MDDADVAGLASAQAASSNACLMHGNSVAQGSIWVQYDDESESTDEDSDDGSEPTDEEDLFSLEQRPHVVACPLLARSGSLPDLSFKLPNSTCLVFDSSSAVLDVRGANFEGVVLTVNAPMCCIA